MIKLRLPFSVILLISIIIACSEQEKIPKDIIQPNSMASLLAELHELENSVNFFGLKKDSANTLYEYYEWKVIHDRGYDSVLFTRSMSWYLAHSKHFDRVYKQVIDTLSLREKQLKRDFQQAEEGQQVNEESENEEFDFE